MINYVKQKTRLVKQTRKQIASGWGIFTKDGRSFTFNGRKGPGLFRDTFLTTEGDILSFKKRDVLAVTRGEFIPQAKPKEATVEPKTE